MLVKEFIAFLKEKFPGVKFFNSTVDKSSKQCIGVFTRAEGPVQYVGPNNISYGILPVSIVIHWTEDAGICEEMARDVYETFQSVNKEIAPSGDTIAFINLLDAKPVWTGRDEHNIAEYVIRANIIYERGAA